MIVEPFAGATVADNLNPVGRVYYSFRRVAETPFNIVYEGRR
jgi:hypothetical protein